MKRKREPEYYNPKINHDIIFQKEKNFSIINNSKLETIREINESRNVINEMQPNLINYETIISKNIVK